MTRWAASWGLACVRRLWLFPLKPDLCQYGEKKTKHLNRFQHLWVFWPKSCCSLLWKIIDSPRWVRLHVCFADGAEMSGRNHKVVGTHFSLGALEVNKQEDPSSGSSDKRACCRCQQHCYSSEFYELLQKETKFSSQEFLLFVSLSPMRTSRVSFLADSVSKGISTARHLIRKVSEGENEPLYYSQVFHFKSASY